MGIVETVKHDGYTEKTFTSTPFSVRSYQQETRPGCWNHQRMEVRRGGDVVGEYVYGYHSGIPFYPFQATDGRWFALYSGCHYTETRVALLESGFEDWYGLPSSGFCPVHFYVPRYQEWKWVMTDDYRNGKKVETYQKEERHFNFDNGDDWGKPFKAGSNAETHEETLIGESNTLCGFVAGCVWGDDHSWKIQYIDLAGVLEKKVVQDDRLGYVHLPERLSLDQAVEVDLWWIDGKGVVRTFVKVTHTTTHWTNKPGHWETLGDGITKGQTTPM